jgi:hypothetical protein
MKRASGILAILLMSCWACGDPAEAEAPQQDPGVRGSRYCEVLLGYDEGTTFRIDVYNSYGLNDCPAEQWDAIDAQQLQQEFQASFINMNGPRYWMIDAFSNSAFLDGAQASLGGIEMRKAGELRVPRAAMSSLSTPYSARQVQRNTTWVFTAGSPVYELVDPSGQVFVMQSFRQEGAGFSEEALSSLGEKLAPPTGWTWRMRQLSEELQVTAFNGVAKIVQDELGNTYQLSQ